MVSSLLPRSQGVRTTNDRRRRMHTARTPSTIYAERDTHVSSKLLTSFHSSTSTAVLPTSFFREDVNGTVSKTEKVGKPRGWMVISCQRVSLPQRFVSTTTVATRAEKAQTTVQEAEERGKRYDLRAVLPSPQKSVEIRQVCLKIRRFPSNLHQLSRERHRSRLRPPCTAILFSQQSQARRFRHDGRVKYETGVLCIWQ